jgi:secondary thiamine-phosphate synthase enzyme
MALRQASQELAVKTGGRGLVEITREIEIWLGGEAMENGLLTVFIRHTSASLLIQENADPDVRGDLDRFLTRLVPDGDSLFRHTAEGPDDMPSHVRAALTQTSLSVPVEGGRLGLGTWQGIYVFEHRLQPQRRTVALHLIGE